MIRLNLKNALKAVLSAMAIIINISLFRVFSNKVINFKVFYNLNITVMALATIVIFILYKNNKKDDLSKSQKLLTLFFALWMLLGEAYVEAGTFKLICENPVILLASIVKVMGYYFIFELGFNYLNRLLKNSKQRELKITNKRLLWYIDKLEKNPFRTSLITILIFWSIYFLAFYPIVLSPDPSYQIIQYFNIPNKYNNWVIPLNNQIFMTAHHPVLQTFLIGWCIEIGRFIANDNLGLFIYTLLQTGVYSSALAMTVKYAHSHGISKKWQLILIANYSLVPMYPFYALSAVKDTLYTAFMLFFVLFIFDIIKNHEQKMSLNKHVWLFIVMLFLCLFRHNGIYVILLTIPFVIIVSRKNWVSLTSMTVGLLVILTAFNNYLVPSLGISGTSVREMLSIPFQQTARVVKEYPNTYSEADKDIIDYVLRYDNLALRYEAEKSDPIKNDYNKYTTSKYLKEYFYIWFKGFLRHPDTYVDATLNNIYGYFYPNAHKWYLYSEYVDTAQKEGAITYHFIPWTKPIRMFLKGWGNLFPYLPFIGLIASIGANTWALLILASYLLNKKNCKYLVTLIPLLTTLLICLISPVNTYFRYTMPYIYALPILAILIFNSIRGGTNEKK